MFNNTFPTVDLNLLTPTAQEIQTTGIGYRYEGISSGTYPIEQSLLFEVEELCNEDAFETTKNLYGLNFKNTKEITNWVYSLFSGVKTVWGLWVSTKIGVEQNYISKPDYECGPVTILRYTLPDKRLILSDLDADGVWFALETCPDWIPSQEVLSLEYKGIY